MTGTVLLLNGAPSAGKTTLARALHLAFPEPAFYMSLDSFRTGVQDRYWSTPDVPRLFNLLLDSWLVVLNDIAARGLPVIAEAVMDEGNRGRYDAALPGADLLMVGVRCELPVLREREAKRTDRRNGEVVVEQEDIDRIHAWTYDVEVYTDKESTDESVDRIISSWSARG